MRLGLGFVKGRNSYPEKLFASFLEYDGLKDQHKVCQKYLIQYLNLTIAYSHEGKHFLFRGTCRFLFLLKNRTFSRYIKSMENRSQVLLETDPMDDLGIISQDPLLPPQILQMEYRKRFAW